MLVNPQIVTAAKRQGVSSRQFVTAAGRTINSDQVVDLLVNKTSLRAQPGARRLLHEMASVPWQVLAAVHQGGVGGDGTAHITLRATRAYHLRLDHSGCIFDITFVTHEDVQRLSGNLPWTPPGA
jgi:hypothetical protein